MEIALRNGEVSVEKLSKAFDVPLQTVRRYLTELTEQGRFKRSRGGALLPFGLRNIGYEHLSQLHDLAKARIGLACAEEVQNGSSLFLGAGTTCEAVARAFIHREGLLIMTNNLNAIPVLSAGGKTTVMATGGRLRQADAGLSGPQAVASVRQFKFDLAIIGCSALDENGVPFDYDLDAVIVSQTVIEDSQTAALLADNSKFNRHAPAPIAPLSDRGLFYTNQAPHKLLPDAVRTGPNLMIAPF